MSDPNPINASARSGGILPVHKPRWAFSKGLLTGAAIEIPLVAVAVWVLARLGVGNPQVELMRIVRLTAVFAGPAALLTAGGIGRLAADAVVEVGRRGAVMRAMRAHAAAGAGLVVIAAIPHGELPGHSYAWLAFPGAGLVIGAVAGAVIGFVCTGQASIVQLVDVWSLARRPRVALRNLLDPEDLVRIGSALRTRTTNLFEGIFEPAPLPPKAGGEPAAAASAPAEGGASAEGAAEPAPTAAAPSPRIDV